MPKAPPELPKGNAGILSGISENFSFHSSPEAFIASRVLAYQRANPDALASRAIVRAKILNRNVAVVSTYDQVRDILTSDDNHENSRTRDRPNFAAQPAYRELMEAFFPPPNLLLGDGSPHAAMRRKWELRIAHLPEHLKSTVYLSTREHFDAIKGSQVDLYDSMKALSWRLLFGTFLGLQDPNEENFKTLESLHEDLLRGQFSLFPVGVNVGFWQSPRSRGIDARKQLQYLLVGHAKSKWGKCPFRFDAGEEKDVADHQLMFTSSLAAKALASLLTACLLNLYIFRDAGAKRVVDRISTETDDTECRKLLESMVLETERLSPPIVGVMRRCQNAYTVTSSGDLPDTIFPEGWDVWMYLVGAGRDESKYGPKTNRFDCWRYVDSDAAPAPPMAFGAGSKTCLGAEVIRSIIISVLETCVAINIQLEAGKVAPGVRGWLGWDEEVSPEQWSLDMKQLPTQRPAKPIEVAISMNPNES